MLSSSPAPTAVCALLLGVNMQGVMPLLPAGPYVLPFTSGTGGEGTGTFVPMDELQFGEGLQGPHSVPTPRAHTQTGVQMSGINDSCVRHRMPENLLPRVEFLI